MSPRRKAEDMAIGRWTMGPERRRWILRAVCVAAAATLLAPGAGRAGGRPQRTVFLSQPPDWAPQVDEDHKPASLVFKPEWTWGGFKSPLAGDPVDCAGWIVASSRDGEVAALDPARGEASWTAALAEGVNVGPATDGTRVFVATSKSRLRAIEGRDGAQAWTVELPAEAVAPPRVVGARVLVATGDGSLLSIDKDSGRIAATQLLPGRASTGVEPAPGTLLVGTDHGALLALEESTLQIRYRRNFDAAITTPLVFDGKRVWFAAADRTVRCVRFSSGRERWVARTGAVCTARPLVRGPYLYVLSYDDDIYVFGKRNGHQLSRVRLGHRLDADAVVARDHLLVVPSTEASLVGLTLPGLQKVGHFDLEAPGEWFTTSPLWVADRVALGYGRSEGKIVSLSVTEQAAPPKPAGQGTPGAATPPVPPASGAAIPTPP